MGSGNVSGIRGCGFPLGHSPVHRVGLGGLGTNCWPVPAGGDGDCGGGEAVFLGTNCGPEAPAGARPVGSVSRVTSLRTYRVRFASPAVKPAGSMLIQTVACGSYQQSQKKTPYFKRRSGRGTTTPAL